MAKTSLLDLICDYRGTLASALLLSWINPREESRSSHNAFLQFHFSVCWGYLLQPVSIVGKTKTKHK